MSLTVSVVDNLSVHIYRIEDGSDPLPCAICGQTPSKGEPALEANHGEPRLLCMTCVSTFTMGSEILARLEGDTFPSGPLPW